MRVYLLAEIGDRLAVDVLVRGRMLSLRLRSYSKTSPGGLGICTSRRSSSTSETSRQTDLVLPAV